MAIIAVAILLAILLAALLLAGLLPLPERRLKDIYAGLLDSEESELLSLAFDETKGQDDFDAFLSAWDAENASLKTVLLVAHVLERRDCFKVPDALLPRIKGGIAVAELHNADISGHFDRIACAFADGSVPFAVIKGAAMRIRRPDYPRWMTDTDVLVEEQNYEKAVRLASGLGYGEPMACGYSTDLHIPGGKVAVADIHCRLDMGTGREEAYSKVLFSRAEALPAYHNSGYIPCAEDMVFISLVNLYKNLKKKQSPQSVLDAFFDLDCLVHSKSGFDWNLVIENAELTGTKPQLLISSGFVSLYARQVFPDGWKESLAVDRKSYERQALEFCFHRKVLASGRDAMAGTNAGKSLMTGSSLPAKIWSRIATGLKPLASIAFVRRLSIRLNTMLSNV